MGRPQVLPIRDNRQRALDYWIRFRQSKRVIEHNTSSIAKDVAKLSADHLRNDDAAFVRAVLAADIIGGYKLALAADSIVAGRSSGWQEAMEALAVGYLGSELWKHRRERTLGLYCRRADDFYYVAFHGVLAGLRLWPQANSLARGAPRGGRKSSR